MKYQQILILCNAMVFIIISLQVKSAVRNYAIVNYGKIKNSKLAYPNVEAGSFLIEQIIDYDYTPSSSGYTDYFLGQIIKSTNFKFINTSHSGKIYKDTQEIYKKYDELFTPNMYDGTHLKPYVAYDIHYVDYSQPSGNQLLSVYGVQMKVKFFNCEDQASFFYNNHVMAKYNHFFPLTEITPYQNSSLAITKSNSTVVLSEILGFPYSIDNDGKILNPFLSSYAFMYNKKSYTFKGKGISVPCEWSHFMLSPQSTDSELNLVFKDESFSTKNENNTFNVNITKFNCLQK